MKTILATIFIALSTFYIGYDMGRKAYEKELIDALKDHKQTLIEFKEYVESHNKNK